MALSPGSRIGPYEVSGKLGEGGMGEVYRARDARLNRDIALKALPSSVVIDPERIARFQREAQVLAALCHPNIAAIYGLEEFEGSPVLVMELVEGTTLAERIHTGPVPIPEALDIARQIADALEIAHEKGIVHRDLKPANIKLTPEGKVKVLDFGLAKALSNDPTESSNPGDEPTITIGLESTRAGTILGTARYMSPEQARGKAVDRRADIWAFGVVLYEMLTGNVAFEGETVTDALAAILRADIEWRRLPEDTPLWVRRLLQRCLERDTKRRLRDIGDAWIEADAPAAAPLADSARRRAAWWIPVAVAVLLGVIGAWGLLRKPAAVSLPVVRSSFTQDQFFGFVALNREGSKLVYGALATNSPMNLVLRMEDQLTGQPIPGAENAIFPFLSPDGEWVAYFSRIDDHKLRKLPVAGGTPVIVVDGVQSAGGDWSGDWIYLGSAQGLKRVPASGGALEALTRVDASQGETSHRYPRMIPGTSALLYTIDSKGSNRLAVYDVAKGGSPRVIMENASTGRYLPTGHLVFVRGAGLYAAPFDPAKLAVTGPEALVQEGISTVGTGAGDFAVSDTGTLVYMAGSQAGGKTVLGVADARGTVRVISDEVAWGRGRLSPDGKRVANEIHGASADTGDVWILEIERKTETRISFEGRNSNPIWSPDGRHLFWSGAVAGKRGIYSAPSDGSARPVLLLETETEVFPGSLTPDGKTLLYAMTPTGKQSEIWGVTFTAAGAAGKPFAIRQTEFSETSPELSPDGKWLAYVSTEAGGREVYVQPFPGPGSKVRVSTKGGYGPRWVRSGREMYYWGGGAGNQLSKVEVQTAPAFHTSAPDVQFSMAAGSTWDIAPDNQHFLIEQLPGGGARRMITVVNWFEELKRRAPLNH